MRDASVQFAVVHQLELAWERGTAVWAHEWIQTAVETRVHDQMLLLGETKRAEGELANGFHRFISGLPFSASLANVRPFSGMELHVSYEMPLQRERFSTFLKAHEEDK